MSKGISREQAIGLATNIVMTSFSAVDSWANELKTLKNISFSPQSLTLTKYECVTFGHYYLRNMIISNLTASDQQIFDSQIMDGILLNLSLGCSSETSESEHEASVKRIYSTFVEDRHPRYARQVYKDNKTILDYFKFNLRENFNQSDFNIKFFNDTPIRRFIIKNIKNKKWVLLNETIIFALADNFFSVIKNGDF